MRFPLAVLEAVCAAWPAGRPLAVRLSATDWARRGTQVEDAVTVAAAMRARGCDLVHLVAGHATAGGSPLYRRGYLTAFSDRIRAGAGVAPLVGSYITSGTEINTIVGAGRADLCLIEAGALSADPATP